MLIERLIIVSWSRNVLSYLETSGSLSGLETSAIGPHSEMFQPGRVSSYTQILMRAFLVLSSVHTVYLEGFSGSSLLSLKKGSIRI